MAERSKEWSSFWCKSKLFYSLIFLSKLMALSMWKCAIENTIAWTAIAMQWPWDGLGKHIPVAKQLQQLNYNNGNRGVFYMVCAEVLPWRQLGWPTRIHKQKLLKTGHDMLYWACTDRSLVYIVYIHSCNNIITCRM